MQLLARDLVQQLLRAEQVLHEADGAAATEVREVRHHGEVLVRAPVVVQHHVVGDDRPADALDQLLRGGQLGVGLQVLGDAAVVPVGGHNARVAGLQIDEVQHLVELLPLALDDADVADVVVLLLGHRVERPADGARRAEAVAVDVDGVVAVGVVRVGAAAQEVRVGLAVQQLDLVGAHPLGDEHVVPLVRVVLVSIRVDQHVLGVQLLDAHLAAQRVGEVQPHVEEATGRHDAVREHVGASPAELVVVRDLHEHLGQGVSDFGRGPLVARFEGDVRAVEDLLAHHVGDGRDDLVDRQGGAALSLEQGQIVLIPLQAGEEVLALGGLLHVFEMAVVTEPRVAVPDLSGQSGINRHVVLSYADM